jgi:hypothetical protein
MMASDEEEDYLTMTFEDPDPDPRTETYSQRRARKLREHDTNSHIKPARELEQERREEGLAKNMFEEKSKQGSKALRMMKLMGYTYFKRLIKLNSSEGKALGAEDSGGHIEPLVLEIPDGILQIGMWLRL